MAVLEGKQGRRPGRPRSEKSQRAILAAAADLLRERPLAEVSMHAVAERAGAGKATIYRWWPSKELLAMDAVFHEFDAARPADADTDTGMLRGDLRALVLPWVRLLGGGPFGHLVAALTVELHRDPAFRATYQARFVEPRRAPCKAAFHRAMERGEIPVETDVEVALDMVYGPIYHRLLHLHAPLDERFAAAVVEGVLGAVGARS